MSRLVMSSLSCSQDLHPQYTMRRTEVVIFMTTITKRITGKNNFHPLFRTKNFKKLR